MHTNGMDLKHESLVTSLASLPPAAHMFRGKALAMMVAKAEQQQSSASRAASSSSAASTPSPPGGPRAENPSASTAAATPSSPPALLLAGVKAEPRLGSPCGAAPGQQLELASPSSYGGPGGQAPPTKRGRPEDWLPSPSQMSVDSLSPSPVLNGHPSSYPLTVSVSNGYSPMSSGSYDPYSPNGKLSQEDLSPPNSLNGYSVDSCGDLKKKKGPTPRQQEELCLVCGDRASGYHYNALTCEGCKGFFRRSITKNAVYQCKYGNNCEIDMYMRRKCQECRLKKCLSVGMRPECVVPEYQCAVKREAKKAQKEKDKPNSTTNGSPEVKEIEHKREVAASLSMLPSCPSSLPEEKPPNGIKPLSTEQDELINRLVYFQDEFEQPSEDDLKRISHFPYEGENANDVRFRHITEMTILTVQLIVEFSKRLPGFDKLLREDQITLLKDYPLNADESETKFKHITEMTILTVQLTVEFSKRLPGFDTLLREDQITLLKACSSEVMMLRTARRYDAETDTILFANNHPYNLENYSMAGVGDSAEAIFHFCRQMCSMKVDNAEYALLTAIVIFSERPALLEPRKVEKIQEIYLEALRAYVDNHRSRPTPMFAKLLSVLTELRTLGSLNSDMCFSLKLKNKKLPPFLAEIWDVTT